MEQLWSLYNKDEKLRIDDLKTEHVRVILLAIPTRRMGEWFACRQGDAHWQAIGDIPEFYEDVRALKGVLPAAAGDGLELPSQMKKVARRPMFEEAPPDFQTNSGLNIITKRTRERRTRRRYSRELQFRVRQSDKEFTCATRDISVGGMSLREPMPKWIPKTFRATLSSHGEKAKVLCERVSETKLKILDSESWELIRKWIVSW